jgi:hypothetical protein
VRKGDDDIMVTWRASMATNMPLGGDRCHQLNDRWDESGPGGVGSP